ncbi:MAG: hypothetical protein ACFFAJ_16195 [Candidatus Hodarchaeota archaeon]
MALRKVVLFLFFVLFINVTIPVLSYSSITLQSKNKKNGVSLAIIDAFYTDLDNDDVLDVVSYFDLSFDSTRHHTVRIDVLSILPSGYYFSYKWIINTETKSQTHQILFFDHAIESGMYDLIIFIRSLTGGISIGVIEYEFDPPGGSGGGDPVGMFR